MPVRPVSDEASNLSLHNSNTSACQSTSCFPSYGPSYVDRTNLIESNSAKLSDMELQDGDNEFKHHVITSNRFSCLSVDDRGDPIDDSILLGLESKELGDIPWKTVKHKSRSSRYKKPPKGHKDTFTLGTSNPTSFKVSSRASRYRQRRRINALVESISKASLEPWYSLQYQNTIKLLSGDSFLLPITHLINDALHQTISGFTVVIPVIPHSIYQENITNIWA